MSSSSKRLLLIELNEFSLDLLRQGIEELKLSNLAKMISLAKSLTKTDDLIEHRGLDPWVQWVSVHTGVPLSEHGVLHLGDAPIKLKHPQLWERLDEMGVTTGVWGAMNAVRGKVKSCKFFLPDPWTFGEPAYPEKLNDLLALPIYYSKNYLDVSKSKFILLSLKLIKFILTSGALIDIIRLTPFMLKGLFKTGLNNALLFTFFDLISTSLFLAEKKKYKPQFALIFLNSIAHIQHHSWHITSPMPQDLKFTLQSMDKIIGLLVECIDKDDALIVMNGLTQRNVTAEPPKIMYRQINPAGFLMSANIDFERVEQLMTFDGHVFFESSGARDFAVSVLKAVHVGGLPLFQVEANLSNPLQLFYQVDFWGQLEPDTEIIVNGKRLKFFSVFEAVVARTGSHIPEGALFSKGVQFKATQYNHEIFHGIVQHFSKAE